MSANNAIKGIESDILYIFVSCVQEKKRQGKNQAANMSNEMQSEKKVH